MPSTIDFGTIHQYKTGTVPRQVYPLVVWVAHIRKQPLEELMAEQEETFKRLYQKTPNVEAPVKKEKIEVKEEKIDVP